MTPETLFPSGEFYCRSCGLHKPLRMWAVTLKGKRGDVCFGCWNRLSKPPKKPRATPKKRRLTQNQLRNIANYCARFDAG